MSQKTVLLIDDEQGLLEALEDALTSEGYRVLKAFTGEEALEILARESIDLATVDVMLPPGASLVSETTSHRTGLYLCEQIVRRYPKLDLFCLSVVSDPDLIKAIQSLGVRFLRKGETPLRTVLNMMRSRLTGIAYSTERDGGSRQDVNLVVQLWQDASERVRLGYLHNYLDSIGLNGIHHRALSRVRRYPEERMLVEWLVLKNKAALLTTLARVFGRDIQTLSLAVSHLETRL